MPDRSAVYSAIDSERAYQEMRVDRDNGSPSHTPEEFLLYMDYYLHLAKQTASTTWGPEAHEQMLHAIRKVTALGVACMEANGAPRREGF